MKTIYAAFVAASIGLATFGPAHAQTANPSPAAMAVAKQIIAVKHIDEIYKGAVPGLVERTKGVLLQSNLNYQKDLNEVAVKVAKELAGREQEIGTEIAKIYASHFTEQELKDLLAFYQSPLGKKAVEEEPQVFVASRQYMEQWAQTFSEEINGKFRAEMRARGKTI
ncbi:MAG: DUF2059 domain-containing protein [Xanthobacteraceae bacterium]|nr:DUF2059 domain-containing protein [Xanthobacteraceae bacterium]